MRGANQDLAHTAEELNKLDGVLKGLGITIYERFKRPLDDSIGSLRDFVTEIEAAIRGTKSWWDVLREVDPGDFKAFEQVKTLWEQFDAWVKEHSGYGARLVPESWTTPQPFVGRAIPSATPEEAATLAQIRSREGAAGGYRAVAGERGPVLTDLSRYPAELGKAAGAYQFLPSTWREAQAATGVTGFTPEDQDKAALWLLRRYGTTPWASSAPPGGYPDLELQRGRILGAGPMAAAAEGGGKVEAPAVPNVAALQKAHQERLKAINEEEKAVEAQYDLEIARAGHNEEATRALEQKKLEAALVYSKQREEADTDLAAKLGEAQQRYAVDVIRAQTEIVKHEQRTADERLAAEISRLEGERKLADQAEQAELAAQQRRLQLGQQTVSQTFANEQAIVSNHAAAVAKILDQEQQLAGNRVRLAQDVADRRKEEEQKTANEMIKINDQAMQRMKQDTDKAVQPISSAFNTIAQNMISRTQTVQQVMRKVFEELVTGPLLKNIEGAFAKALEGGAFGESGLGRFFAGTLFSGAGAGATAAVTTANTVATTANTVATTANSAAQSSGGLLSGLGSLFKMIPIIGMLFEKGGIVSMQSGGLTGSGMTIGLLHPREMVLPSHITSGLVDMIGAGMRNNISNNAVLNHNPTINVNGGSTMTRQQFETVLRTHGDALLGHARNLVRNGWSP
jgi:hypothetical protein